jgi:two-component system sensor histidine kinase PilS (NtrC family)
VQDDHVVGKIAIPCLFLVLLWNLSHRYAFPLLSHRILLYSQLLPDLILISILVYISGGIISPLYFLYLLPIMISANFLERRDTVIMASLAFISYGTLSDLIYLHVLPPFASGQDTIPMSGFIYNLAMAFFSFLVVAVLSSYYFERIRLTSKELANAVANLKDLLELNSTLLDQIEDGFFTADDKRKIISYNKKACNLLNYPNSSRHVQELFDQAKLRLNEKENHIYFEFEIMGHVLGVSVNRLNDIYSFHELFVFVIHDLTEKRLFEQELRKKEHLALIGEMSAGMAHELRNPLASISGSVQYLQKQLPYQTDTHHLMQIIVTETKRLSRSIEDFLSFARDTPLNRMEFDLTALLDEVIQLSHLSSQGVFHILKDYASKEVMINADYEKMRQIVQNLLSNGLKAIEKTGTLTVSLARKKGKLRLAIKDSGIGMDSEILKEIFTPFYSNFSKGIGLGMAIVKKIVEAHRYEIEIRSEKGKGTEVILWIE